MLNVFLYLLYLIIAKFNFISSARTHKGIIGDIEYYSEFLYLGYCYIVLSQAAIFFLQDS